MDFLRCIRDVFSRPWITPKGKAQAVSKAQQPRQYVSISKRPATPPLGVRQG